MIKRPLNDVQDKALYEHFRTLQEESFQNPLTLDTAPASGALQLSPNEMGVVGGKLYIRVGNTVYELTPSSTIT